MTLNFIYQYDVYDIHSYDINLIIGSLPYSILLYSIKFCYYVQLNYAKLSLNDTYCIELYSTIAI